MLEPYMALALAGRMLALTVFGAIFIIIQFQLRQDALSRALLNLVVIFAANTGLSLIVRFMSLAGDDITLPFNCIIVLVGAIPGMVFMFVVTYFEAWTPLYRRLAWLFMGYLLLDGVLSGLHALSANVRILPDGILEFDRLPLANLMVGLGQVGLFVSLGVLWMQYRKRRHQGGQWNNGVLVGVLILVMAGITIAFPTLTRYTTEQFLYAFGAVALVRPVLRQRLFDPLAKLNASLAHRAEQFAIITRVSQQANAHLNLLALLNAVVQHLHDAFGYYAVSIYLPEADRLVVHAAAGFSAAAFVQSGDSLPLESAGDALTYDEDLSEVQGHSSHPLRPASRSLVRIPLRAAASDDPAAEQRLVGLLDIQSERAAAFGPDDREVFAILANQIAIAIRNAELFEQIQQSNRYKTRFIHTISHELRTPLQTVTGNLDFLSFASMYPGTVLTERYLEDVELIQRATRHLQSLLDNILDMGKIESGETELVMQPVDPAPLLAELEKTFSGSVKPGVALLHHYPADLPPVQADNLRLTQILTNLLSNACKFTVEGQISLDVKIEETRLVFSVADTGPGIAPEIRPRLFTSFVQGSRFISREFGGTGLGLSISRHLARLMGGDVWFESAVGQGSTFYCALPLADLTGQGAGSGGMPPRAERLEKPATVPDWRWLSDWTWTGRPTWKRPLISGCPTGLSRPSTRPRPSASPLRPARRSSSASSRRAYLRWRLCGKARPCPTSLSDWPMIQHGRLF
jgi:signal transduction histidine kinase